MDMPKGKVAKAFAVPMIIALIPGYLIPSAAAITVVMNHQLQNTD